MKRQLKTTTNAIHNAEYVGHSKTDAELLIIILALACEREKNDVNPSFGNVLGRSLMDFKGQNTAALADVFFIAHIWETVQYSITTSYPKMPHKWEETTPARHLTNANLEDFKTTRARISNQKS